MKRCDFCSVMTIVRSYISEDRGVAQVDLLYELFAGFLEDEGSLDFDFDNGQVCRWLNGQAKVSPRICGFYIDQKNQIKLSEDIKYRILPLMFDSAMAIQDIYNLIIQDCTISDKKKKRLTECHPCRSENEEAVFLANALCFGMERTFVKRVINTKQLMSAGNLSPVVKDFIYDSDIPRPCRYFCGRDTELNVLRELLLVNGKVFLQDIAGIGKSELAKAYAKHYSKEYTNILY